MIRNIIFDWSGTLVDDLPAVWEATNYVLAQSSRPEMTLAEFRAEAFNAINLVNYDTYANNLADPRFGQAITAAPARAVQLMLRLNF